MINKGQKQHSREIVDYVMGHRNTKTSSELGAELGLGKHAVKGIWRRNKTGNREERFQMNKEERQSRQKDVIDLPRFIGYATPLEGPVLDDMSGAARAVYNLGRGCKWPCGHPNEPGFRYCGEVREQPGKPYCTEHRRLAWNTHGNLGRYNPNFRHVTATNSNFKVKGFYRDDFQL